MRDDTGTLQAGMAVVFSYGCYSDYGFGQVFICATFFIISLWCIFALCC